MTEQIAVALNVAAEFVTNVRVEGKYVWFDLNGAEFSATLTRGKFDANKMRRA